MRVRGLSVWVFALVGAGRGGRSRTVAAVLCACVCALGACLALATAPSLAASGGGGTFGPLTASDFSAVTPAVSPGGDLAFGSEGEGAGQLDKPHGVAVDRSTGDVYVADKANDRVDEFEEDGTFVRTWGWGVVDGKSEFEVCTSSCRAGPEEAQGAGAMFRPVGIAIDQATGDVYVIDLENDRVQEFTASGAFVTMWGGKVDKKTGGDVCPAVEASECQKGAEGTGDGEFENLGEQGAIAVDPATHDVYVGDYRRVQEFEADGKFVTSFPVEVVANQDQVEAIAVMSGGALSEHEICLTVNPNPGAVEAQAPLDEVLCYSATGVLQQTIKLEEESGSPSANAYLWLAADEDGHLVVDEYLLQNKVGGGTSQSVTEYGEAGKAVERFGPPGGDATSESREPGGLALMESGGVASGVTMAFIKEGVVRGEAIPVGPVIEAVKGVPEPGASATFSATIVPEGKTTEYHFDYGTSPGGETLEAPVPPATMAEKGVKPETVEVTVSHLTPKATYYFHVVAKNSEGKAEAEGAPFEALPAVAVEGLSAVEVTGDSAELRALVDPVGTDTHYHFEWAAAGEGEHEGPSVDVGAGSQNVAVSEPLRDLRAGTAYTYRIVATNTVGEASAQARLTAQSAVAPPALLDGRGWEQVSPPNKGVANITLFLQGGGPLLASPSGDAITYLSRGGSELEPQSEPLASQNVSRHGPGGWSTRDIASPNAQRYNVKAGESGEYQIFSDDLERSIVASSPYTALSQWTVGRERTQYVRDESDCPTGVVSVERLQQTECFTPLLTDTGPYKDVEEGIEYGGPRSNQRGLVSAVAATPDLSHVVLKANRATKLTSGAGGSGLYEWDAGRLSLLSQTKAGTGCAGTLGVPGNFSSLGYNSQNALSPDGALAVWGGGTEVGGGECAGHLYLRDVPHAMTVQLDEVHGVADAGQPEAVYEDASVGDEHIFFTDSQRLTGDSSATQFGVDGALPTAADLYEYAFDAATDTGSLVDMTAPVNAGEAAGVLNVVGASEDGSVVYVVATGVLTPETEENGSGEHAVSGRPNLYALERVDGSWKARYIAMLSETDHEDWGAPGPSEKGIVAERGTVEFQTTRVSPDGRWLAFMSDRSLTGYDNEDVTSRAPGERMDEEVFLYDANTNRVVCASCDPTGARPHGMFVNDNPNGGGENPEPLIDREGVWENRWLAATVPARYSDGRSFLATLRQPRYLSNGGRLFFDSVDGLVSGAHQGVTAPYEYEPPANGEIKADGGHDTCTTASSAYVASGEGCLDLLTKGASSEESMFMEASENGNDVFVLTSEKLAPSDIDSAYVASGEGCLDLLTKGASSEESMFMEASENGNDVFVLTSEKLAPSDIDSAYDVYDAHVCGSGWECPSPAAVSPPCITTESCRSAPASQPAIYGASGTATFAGSGNPASATQTGGASTKKTTKKKMVKCKKGLVKRRVKKKQECVKKANKAKKTKRRGK